MIRIAIAVLLCVLLFVTGCGSSERDGESTDVPRGPWLGQAPPGNEPLLFAPGILSTSLHDDCPAVFSLDGREVFFRKWAVPHDIVGHMRMADDGTWSRPVLFRPDGDCLFLHPVFLPGTDLALLNGFRPHTPGGEMPEHRGTWQAAYRDGEWTDWKWSELNFRGDVGVWSISNDGTAYIHAAADDGQGRDFWTARRVDGAWTEPERLDIPLDGSGRMPTIAPDGSYLIYSIAGRDDGFGHNDLYVSFPNGDGSWGEPHNLGEPVNSSRDDKFTAISPDGAYLFYVSSRAPDRQRDRYSDRTYDELMEMNEGPCNGLGRGDVYWVSTDVVEQARSR